MSSSDLPDFQAHLQELQQRLQVAADGPFPEDFRQVAAELLGFLEGTPIEQVPRGATRLYLLVVERLVTDLLESRPELAITLCRLGQQRAASVKAEFWRRWFTLLGVQACTQALDLASAASVLIEEFGVSLEPPLATRAEEWVSACEQFASMLAPAGVRAELHVLALTTAGRWAAAVGQLALADRLLALSYSRAVRLGAPAALLVALRLGELRVDRGDHAGFEELALRVVEDQVDVADPHRWELLRASASRAAGRLTEARIAFGRLSQQTRSRMDPGEAEVYLACLLQEADILIALNRIDEAEQVVESLEGLGPSAKCRAAEFRFRIDDRVGESEPTAAPIALIRPLFTSAAVSLPEPKVEAWPRREAERLHDDVCRGLNASMGLLRRGQRSAAGALLKTMREWVDACDSRLILGRVELVEAIAYEINGEPTRARVRCAQAIDAFESLDVSELLWVALRVQGWILARSGTPQEREDNRRQQDDALGRLHEGLSAEDRVYHMLNRWTQVDLQTRAVLDELANIVRPEARTEFEATLAWIEHTRTWSHLLRNAEVADEDGERPISGIPALVRRRRRMKAITGTRGRWLPPRTAVLRYLSLPDGLEGFLLWRRGHYRIRSGAAHGRPELRRRLARLLKYTYRSNSWKADTPWVVDLSAMLGLEEIFEVLPPEIEQLAIVPDGLLDHVPYALLRLDGVSLLDRFVPSIIVRYASTWLRPSLFDRRRSSMTCIGVGRTPPSMGLQPLDGVPKELAALTQNGRTATQLLDESATIAAAQQRLRSDAIIHFACHGRFDPTDPVASGIALHDGWMTTEDLMGIVSESPTSLVSMSTCWGANMGFLPGREIVSFPTALLDMGVEWVIASLLPVQDRQNPHVLTLLYDGLWGEDPARALAHAQRSCMSSGMPGRDWGAYVALRSYLPVRRGLRWWARMRARHWPLHGGARD